jgi:hypothetical protein
MPNIKDFVSPVEQGFLLTIPIDETFTGVFVNIITMFVAAEAEDDWYSDSDLAVVYSTAKPGSYTSLDAMNMFYWHDAYTGTLQDKLVAAGFSANAAHNVATSEWGMQDEQRASYDAYTIADEVRAAML